MTESFESIAGSDLNDRSQTCLFLHSVSVSNLNMILWAFNGAAYVIRRFAILFNKFGLFFSHNAFQMTHQGMSRSVKRVRCACAAPVRSFASKLYFFRRTPNCQREHIHFCHSLLISSIFFVLRIRWVYLVFGETIKWISVERAAANSFHSFCYYYFVLLIALCVFHCFHFFSSDRRRRLHLIRTSIDYTINSRIGFCMFSLNLL